MEDAFRELHGRTLNFNSMVQAVGKLNKWYEEKGVLGQVRRTQSGAGSGVLSGVLRAAAPGDQVTAASRF